MAVEADNAGGGGRGAGDERADVPALDVAVRGGEAGGSSGPALVGRLAPQGSGRGGRGAGGDVFAPWGGGVREGIAAKGIFASLYTDRGSHYWYTPRAGGKVNRGRPEPGGRWGSWGSR